jgi:hypothetical protein
MLLVRFAVPLVAFANEATFQLFLADEYATGQATVELSTEKFRTISAPVVEPPGDESVGERLQRWWQSAAQSMDVARRYEEMRQVAGNAVEHIVRLIVVFMLQTVVLPLLLLWALLRLVKATDVWGGGRG